MDMDHLIGQRFNLISKSEIRYVGTLHEINPEQSTIALEDVYSFGTEGRKVDKFIPPSPQRFDYIVFRGSDVKDIKIAEDEKDTKESQPPNIPNDPAILNSSRPGPAQPRGNSPFHPPGYPPQPQFGGYYPPPQQFGRGFGGFGQAPPFPPYGPPPPGYFGPPGQGYPPAPNEFLHQPPPIGPPGQRGNPPHNQHPPQQPPTQQQKPDPPTQGLGQAPKATQSSQKPQSTSELPVDNKTSEQSREIPAAPSATQPAPTSSKGVATKAPPQPKSNKVTPAVPFTVNQKSFVPPAPTASDGQSGDTNGAVKSASKPVASQAAMDEAARQAKEAVAAAMAKLNPQTTTQARTAPTTADVNALSKKVSEMNTTSNGAPRGRGGYRGTRGSYPRGGAPGQATRRIDIPKSDFDFESANAKFSKEDLIKEAIAAGSPVNESPEDGIDDKVVGEEHTEDTPKKSESISAASGQAYNRATSFFDNISSEAKDREEVQDGRSVGRQMRGEEFKKNVETFGQGNVDGGYRGRGRGGFKRGRQYGGNHRGYNNRGTGYRGRGRGASQAAAPSTTET